MRIDLTSSWMCLMCDPYPMTAVLVLLPGNFGETQGESLITRFNLFFT